MKKIIILLALFLFGNQAFTQELNANVMVNFSQIGGSNTQIFKTLEKSLKDFINKTSWTGKRLQDFEKIKCTFAVVVSSRESQNRFKGSILVQSARPVYGSVYESPMLNINDGDFTFEYTENENLIFNERQFSGKNLIDVISFYIYMILGADGDSFAPRGGQQFFDKALKISQNAQNQGFSGWSPMEGTRTRGVLINTLVNNDSQTLRQIVYGYHRNGIDNLYKQDQTQAKKTIFNELAKLSAYSDNFQMNYPLSVFLDTKSTEIFNIFNTKNNGTLEIPKLKSLMNTMLPKDSDSKWNKWN